MYQCTVKTCRKYIYISIIIIINIEKYPPVFNETCERICWTQLINTDDIPLCALVWKVKRATTNCGVSSTKRDYDFGHVRAAVCQFLVPRRGEWRMGHDDGLAHGTWTKRHECTYQRAEPRLSTFENCSLYQLHTLGWTRCELNFATDAVWSFYASSLNRIIIFDIRIKISPLKGNNFDTH